MTESTQGSDSREDEWIPVKVEAAPLRQKIITALRRAIELGTLKEGDRLVEKDLCKKLQVSRTSLREALRELEAHGVVNNISTRQLTIATIPYEDAVNLYRVRESIETLLVGQFVKNGTEQDFVQLRRAFEQLKKAGRRESLVDSARAFYRALCNGARNDVAHEFLSTILLRISVLRSRNFSNFARGRQGIEDTEIMLQRIEKRDGAGAMRAARRRVKNAEKMALDGWEGSAAGSGRLAVSEPRASPDDLPRRRNARGHIQST